LLDAALEHKDDEDLEVFHEVGPKPKRTVVAPAVNRRPCERLPE